MAQSEKPFTQYSADDFLAQPVGRKSDGNIGLRVRRSILVAAILSILLHSILAFNVIRLTEEKKGGIFPPSDKIVVTLAPPPTAIKPKQAEPQPAQKKQAEQKPEQKKMVKVKKKPVKKRIKKKAPAKPKPRVIAKKSATQPAPSKKSDFTVPEELIQTEPTPTPAPEATPTPTEAAPTDMASFVKQQQAKRQVQEQVAARENAIAIAKLKGPSKEELRNQRIEQNLKSGTNGIFEITRMDALGASFKFKGWTNDYSAARMEYFDVPAQRGKDIKRLVVKRMIKLIRTHYDGDFQWQSHRLARSITLSARVEDNEGLEDFLMQEFFWRNR